MPGSSSANSSDERRSLSAILGGGKVADVLLWRNRWLSGGILAGVTGVWLLLEVVEYSLVSLLCHLSITAMLVVFVWCNGAALVGREPPQIPTVILSRDAFEEAAVSFHSKLNRFLGFLHRMASGENLKLFFLTIASLWLISVIGSCTSFVNTLYLGFLCVQSLPFLYEKYEGEVHRLASRVRRDFEQAYERVDSRVLKRIPRGPTVPSKDKFKQKDRMAEVLPLGGGLLVIGGVICMSVDILILFI